MIFKWLIIEDVLEINAIFYASFKNNSITIIEI